MAAFGWSTRANGPVSGILSDWTSPTPGLSGTERVFPDGRVLREVAFADANLAVKLHD